MVEPTHYEAHLQGAPDYQEVGILSERRLNVYSLYLRNPHALITRRSTGSMPRKVTSKQLGLEQLHVHTMDVSSHNWWLTFKREKGLALMVHRVSHLSLF